VKPANALGGKDVVHIPARVARAESRIVEAQHRVVHVAEFFALEGGLAPGFFHGQMKGPSDFKGELGFAGARFSCKQQRLFHGDGDVHDFAKLRIEIVPVGSFKAHGVGFLNVGHGKPPLWALCFFCSLRDFS
jgi:hypothetical protein